MTTDTELRFLKLRQWMDEHCVTYSFVAPHLGVTPSCVHKMFRRNTMPTKHYRVCVGMGFPQEVLPTGADLKRGQQAKIPTIPAMRKLCQPSATV